MPSAGVTRFSRTGCGESCGTRSSATASRFDPFSTAPKIGVPHGLAVATAAPIIAGELRINDVTDDAVEADLAALPGWLDRVDDWIAGGVLGAEPPNAADFQIAAALRLAMTMDDLRPAIEGRPCWRAGEAPGPRLPRPDPARASSGMARAASARGRYGLS